VASSEKVHKFYTQDLRLRASAAVTTQVVQEMCTRQNLFPLGAMGLGRVLTGALLMASQLRAEQNMSINFRGDGPLGVLFAEASFESETRGYCQNPHADPPRKNGHLDLPAGVGRGVLTIARNMPFQKQPQVGIVPIVSGEIGDDLAHYMFQSHQIPSVISLAVSLDKDGKVQVAGGVLIEVLPGATDSLLATLEKKAREARPLSQQLIAGVSPRQLVEAYTHGSTLVEVDHPYPISYTCRCSLERVERTLLLLGKEALEEMVAEGQDRAIQCQFCGRTYQVTLAEMKALLHPN
jgi:molecular chaperone Hsp33